MSPGLPIREFISVFWRTWVVILAPFLFSPMVIFNADDPKVLQKKNVLFNVESQLLEAMKCAYLIVLMATYWMTEAMPLPITSMIPMVTRIPYVIYFH